MPLKNCRVVRSKKKNCSGELQCRCEEISVVLAHLLVRPASAALPTLPAHLSSGTSALKSLSRRVPPGEKPASGH